MRPVYRQLWWLLRPLGHHGLYCSWTPAGVQSSTRRSPAGPNFFSLVLSFDTRALNSFDCALRSFD